MVCKQFKLEFSGINMSLGIEGQGCVGEKRGRQES